MVTVERDVGARTLLQAPRGSGFQRSAVVVVGVTTAAAAASQVAVVVEDVVAVVITGMFVARSSLLRSSFGIAVKTRLQGGVQTLHLTSLAPSPARLGALATQRHGSRQLLPHSKPARSDSHPTRIGSNRKRWPEASQMILAQSACFWIRPVRPKPDLTQSTRTQIGPGLVLHSNYDPGRLWQTAAESEGGTLEAGRLRSARTGPDDSRTPACFWTRCVWPKPDQAIQIGSGPVLHNMIWAFRGRTELRMREAGSGI